MFFAFKCEFSKGHWKHFPYLINAHMNCFGIIADINDGYIRRSKNKLSSTFNFDTDIIVELVYQVYFNPM